MIDVNVVEKLKESVLVCFVRGAELIAPAESAVSSEVTVNYRTTEAFRR